MLTIFGPFYTSIGQGTWAGAYDASTWLSIYWENTSMADGDNCSFTIEVPTSGTYTLILYAHKGSDYGVLDIDINGTEVASFDLYNSSAVKNQRLTQTGISLTAGVQDLKLRVDGKNASSSGYRVRMQAIFLFQS